MKILQLILLACVLVSANAWADIFCPNSFNSYNMGDTLAAVEASCGKADSEKKYVKKPPQAQEWVYYIAADPNMPGTLKITIAFDAAGKAINISVNGAGVSQSNICNNNPIQTGATQAAITTACGKPAYINETQPQAGGPKDAEMVEWTYASSPPVVLVFQDGVLKEKK